MNGLKLKISIREVTKNIGVLVVAWALTLSTANAFVSMPSIDSGALTQRVEMMLNQEYQHWLQEQDNSMMLDQVSSILENNAGLGSIDPSLAALLDLLLASVGSAASTRAEYGVTSHATIPTIDPTNERQYKSQLQTELEMVGASIRDCALIESEYIRLGVDNDYLDEQILNCARAQVVYESKLLDPYYATSMNQHRSDQRLADLDQYKQVAEDLRNRDNAGAQRSDLELGLLLFVANTLEGINKTQNDQLFLATSQAEQHVAADAIVIESKLDHRKAAVELVNTNFQALDW